MRIAGVCLLLLSIALGTFYAWGIHTVAGRRRFDEMAGMIPFGAGVLAVVLVIVSAVLLVISTRSATD